MCKRGKGEREKGEVKREKRGKKKDSNQGTSGMFRNVKES